MTAAADWTAWTCRVRVVVVDPAALEEARAVLTDTMAAVDRACSRFRPDSELATLEAAAGRWTPVSPVLLDLLSVALTAARATDGDVDPTVGASLVELGYDRDIADIPSAGCVVSIAAPGWQSIELDVDAGRARVAPGVRVDLGATAKAWTADAASAEITRRTGSGCLVSIGGDVAVAGPPPGPGWRIRVEDVAGHPTSRRPAPPPSFCCGPEGWRRPRPASGGGSATDCRCTTSSTRAPGCRPYRPGGPSRPPRTAAWPPTR